MHVVHPPQNQIRLPHGRWVFYLSVSPADHGGKLGGTAEVNRDGTMHCKMLVSPAYTDAAAAIAELTRLCVSWCRDWERREEADDVGPGTASMPML